MTQEIGGYFELSLNQHNNFPYQNGLMLQSARSSLVHFLKSISYNRVYTPVYCCPTVESILAHSDITTTPYHLNKSFWPEINLDDIGPDDYVLYVNYFGICDDVIMALVERGVNLIVDNSHCLFRVFKGAACTLFSPKKFAGLPDGGVIVTDIKTISEPKNQDTSSISRMSHLLLRASEGAEAGYESFKTNRATLNKQSPKLMSALTRRLIEHIDWDNCKDKRTQNFLYLHNKLKSFNAFNLDKSHTGAFCYPLFMPDADTATIRQNLIKKKIFIPQYWPDLVFAKLNKFEQTIMHKTLALPVDQRHSANDLDFVIKTLLWTMR